MTREEAIKVIRNMLAVTDLTVRGNMTGKMVEACQVAIEALKAEPCDTLKLDGMLEDAYEHGYEQARHDFEVQPCEDCVSRQAMIAGIREYWHDEYYQRVPITEEREDLINDVINHLPPVTPKQRWIPVNYDRYPETYPKAFQEVWITDGYGEVRHIAYDGTRSIKAWMPYVTPEPYKEGESE